MTYKPDELTAALINEHLRYDREAGKFYWRPRARKYFASDESHNRWNKGYAGREALCSKASHGYYGKLFGWNLPARRAAWAIVDGVMPPVSVRHINGDCYDTRWCNLELSSTSEDEKARRRRKIIALAKQGVTRGRIREIVGCNYNFVTRTLNAAAIAPATTNVKKDKLPKVPTDFWEDRNEPQRRELIHARAVLGARATLAALKARENA